MFTRFLFLILPLAFGCSFVARGEDAPPPVLAIVPESGTPALEAFSDVLSAELSAPSRKFALVERAELRRLAGERSLQSMNAGERSLALARLAKADGLVFLGHDETSPEKTSFTMRLVACGNGMILRSLRLSAEEKEIPTAARFAADSLGFAAPSLESGKDDTQAFVSLLGLRSSAGAYDPLTTLLNTALAHQLAAQPGIAVLERWKLDDVVFERALAESDQPKLATGTTLVDGSFRREREGFIAEIRLRAADRSDERLCVVESHSPDPQELPGKIAAEIAARMRSGSYVPYDSQAEARHYAELGKWLSDRGIYHEAVQALESAVALGDVRFGTALVRGATLGRLVNPHDGLDSISISRMDGEQLDSLKEPEFRKAVAYAIRLTCLVNDLAAAGWSDWKPGKADDRVYLIRGALEIGEQTLQSICVRSDQAAFAEEGRLLREQCRRLVAAGRAVRGDAFNRQDMQAGFIYDTPEQAVAAFEEMFDPRYFKGSGETPGAELRFSFWQASGLEEGSRKAMPWLPVVDWSGAEQGRAVEVWKSFIRKLAASPHLLNQVDALALAYQRVNSLAEKDEILGRYCGLLEKNTGWFLSGEGQEAFAAFGAKWIRQTRSFPPRNASRFYDLLVRLYEEADWVSENIHYHTFSALLYGLTDLRGKPPGFVNQDRAGRFLKALDACLVRAKRHPNWQKTDQKETVFRFAELKTKIREAYPGLAVTEAVEPLAGAVPIRIWSPLADVTPEPGPSWISGAHLRWDGERLLVPLAGNRIHALDPVTMRGESFVCPDHFQKHWSMAVTNGRMMIYADGFHLSDYRTAPGSWRRLDDPGFQLGRPAHWEVSACDGRFYFGISPNHFIYQTSDIPLFQTRIGKYGDGQVEWVASSSRIPPRHILDGKRPRGLLHVFPGWQGRPIALMNFPTGTNRVQHYYELEPGAYRADLYSTGLIQKNGDRVLDWMVYDGELMHIVAFDPGKEKPDLWMRKPKSVSGIVPLGNAWEKVPPLLDSGRPEFEGEVIAPIVHDGKLWLLKWEPTERPHQPNALRLVAFDLKTLKSVTVPLLYDVPERIRSIKATPGLDLSAPMIEEDSLIASPHGLYFTARGKREGGYQDWVRYSPVLFHVGWEEVNAWIAANAPGALGP